MASKPNKSLLGQFYQRKVMRVGLAYILIGWILMQVGEVTFEALSLPLWSLTFLIILVVLGFPIALLLIVPVAGADNILGFDESGSARSMQV